MNLARIKLLGEQGLRLARFKCRWLERGRMRRCGCVSESMRSGSRHLMPLQQLPLRQARLLLPALLPRAAFTAQLWLSRVHGQVRRPRQLMISVTMALQRSRAAALQLL